MITPVQAGPVNPVVTTEVNFRGSGIVGDCMQSLTVIDNCARFQSFQWKSLQTSSITAKVDAGFQFWMEGKRNECRSLKNFLFVLIWFLHAYWIWKIRRVTCCVNSHTPCKQLPSFRHQGAGPEAKIISSDGFNPDGTFFIIQSTPHVRNSIYIRPSVVIRNLSVNENPFFFSSSGSRPKAWTQRLLSFRCAGQHLRCFQQWRNIGLRNLGCFEDSAWIGCCEGHWKQRILRQRY